MEYALLKILQNVTALKPASLNGLRAVTQIDYFCEALRLVTDKLDAKNFYAFNPSFDK